MAHLLFPFVVSGFPRNQANHEQKQVAGAQKTAL
jgi:hypothetical protein